MAFDLASAKPESQGFDLASATPITKPKLSANDALAQAYLMGGPYAGVSDPNYRTIVGTGLTDAPVAIGELTGLVSPEVVRAREARYQQAAAQGGEGAGFGRFMGGAITTAPLAAIPGAGPSANLLTRMAIGAGTNAATSMLTQPTSGEGDFWNQKSRQGVGGAVVGGALPLLAEGVKGATTLVRGAKGSASTEQLKAAETAAWDRVKESTAAYNTEPLRSNLKDTFKDYNYDPRTFPALKEAIKSIDDAAESSLGGSPTSIHELRTIRTMLQNVQSSNSAVPAEKGLAGVIKAKIDGFMSKQGGEDAAAWVDARKISDTLFKSRNVKDILAASEESSKATSQQIRERFSELLDSKVIKSYSAEQQALIKDIAEGNLTEKGLELVGKMAPKSLTWGKIAALLGIGGVGHQYLDPRIAGITAAMFGGGAAARGAANTLAKQRVNLLDELIRGGRVAPMPAGVTNVTTNPYTINLLTPANRNSMSEDR